MNRDLSKRLYPFGLATPIKPYPESVILFIEHTKISTPQKAIPERIKRISNIHKKSWPTRSVNLDRIDLFLTHFLLNLCIYWTNPHILKTPLPIKSEDFGPEFRAKREICWKLKRLHEELDALTGDDNGVSFIDLSRVELNSHCSVGRIRGNLKLYSLQDLSLHLYDLLWCNTCLRLLKQFLYRNFISFYEFPSRPQAGQHSQLTVHMQLTCLFLLFLALFKELIADGDPKEKGLSGQAFEVFFDLEEVV